MGCFALRGISLDDEVDYCLGPCTFRVGSVFTIALVKLAANVVVHLATVSPMHIPAGKVQIFEGIDFGIGLMPANLALHAIGQDVAASLSSQGGVPEA